MVNRKPVPHSALQQLYDAINWRKLSQGCAFTDAEQSLRRLSDRLAYLGDDTASGEEARPNVGPRDPLTGLSLLLDVNAFWAGRVAIKQFNREAALSVDTEGPRSL